MSCKTSRERGMPNLLTSLMYGQHLYNMQPLAIEGYSRRGHPSRQLYENAPRHHRLSVFLMLRKLNPASDDCISRL